MPLTDAEREERDPVAIQLELLEIDKQMEQVGVELLEWGEKLSAARAMYDVRMLRLKLLKERRSSLQSVLKSLTVT